MSAVEAVLARAAHDELFYALVDDAGLIVEAGRPVRELVGRDVRGARLLDLVVEFERGLSLPDLARAGATRRLNFIAFTGLPRSLNCTFSLADGRIVVVGASDVREQELLRRELVSLNQQFADRTRALQKANAELARLGDLKDTFLGMAAHDLRSPLTVLIAYAQFLDEDLGATLPPADRQYLDTIRSSAEFMRHIVDAFLDASLIQSGRLRLSRRPTALAPIVEAALGLVAPVAARKGVTLRLQSSDAPPVPLDGPKFEQVVLNLVKNAIDHSPAGAEVCATLRTDGAHVVVEVSDAGAGISEGIQRDLFKGFLQGGAQKTAGERSIGLGLAISRLIVEAHGGTIGVTSAQGAGATFSVRLPLT